MSDPSLLRTWVSMCRQTAGADRVLRVLSSSARIAALWSEGRSMEDAHPMAMMANQVLGETFRGVMSAIGAAGSVNRLNSTAGFVLGLVDAVSGPPKPLTDRAILVAQNLSMFSFNLIDHALWVIKFPNSTLGALISPKLRAELQRTLSRLSVLWITLELLKLYLEAQRAKAREEKGTGAAGGGGGGGGGGGASSDSASALVVTKAEGPTLLPHSPRWNVVRLCIDLCLSLHGATADGIAVLKPEPVQAALGSIAAWIGLLLKFQDDLRAAYK